MNKIHRPIRSIEDLKARQMELKREMVLAKEQAIDSISPTRKKVTGFLVSRIAPVAAVGLGTVIAYRYFTGIGSEEEEAEQAPPKHAEDKEGAVQRDAIYYDRDFEASSVPPQSEEDDEEEAGIDWNGMVRTWWPILKVIISLVQTFYVKKKVEEVDDTTDTDAPDSTSGEFAT